jgi:hypothetical protein
MLVLPATQDNKSHLNPRQAIREALLVVALPGLVLECPWYWIGVDEDWPIYLALFLVPTVLLLPLVYQWRSGISEPSALVPQIYPAAIERVPRQV